MNTIRTRRIAPRLPSLSAVEAYLQSNGWTKAPQGSNKNALIYRGHQDIYGEPLVIGLPARPDLRDADYLIARAVRGLATLEAITPQAMAKKIIKHSNTDVALTPTT